MSGEQTTVHAVRRAPAAGIGILLLAAAYALVGIVGRLLELEPVRVSPMWPSAGVGVAGLLLWGRRMWPGVLLGSFALNLGPLASTSSDWPVVLVSSFGIAASAALSAWLAATLVRRFAGERVPFHTVRSLAIFVAAALLCPLANALAGTAAVRVAGYVPADQLAPAAVSWWLGDVVGILVVAPALLLLGEHHHMGPRRQPVEALLVLLALAVSATIAFGPWLPIAREYPLSHLALPAMVWLSLRFGLAGAAGGNLLVAIIAIVGTVDARGPFASGNIGESLRMLQVFVAVVSTTFLALATTMEERIAAQRALEETRGKLAERVAERTRDLDRSLALLRATLDATADGILAVDRQGRVLSFNQRFLDLWRMPRGLVEEGVDDRVLAYGSEVADDPAAFRERVRAIYAQPRLDSEDTILLRDGRVIARLSRPQWLGGVPVGRVWSFRDVTARVLAEAERDRLLVQEQQARLAAEEAHARTAFLADAGRSLAHSMSFTTTLRRVVGLAVSAGGQAAVLHLVQDGVPIEVAAAEVNGTVHGWVRDEEGGDPPGPDVQRYVTQVLASGEVGQWPGTPESGPLVCVPLFSRGATMGALTIARNVDAPPFRPEEMWVFEGLGSRCASAVENARLYREAQEAVRVRDDFLSIASHELKTPLTTLKLQLQKTQRLMRRDTADPRVAQMFESVVRQTGRLHALIDSLLDISRITTHGIALEREPLDLGAVAGEAVERAREDAARAGSPVRLGVSGDARGEWDRLRVEQVVGNLISNAIKYGAGRPIDVRVTGLDGRVRLEVEDHGIGISEQDQARIFDRFERAVASRHFGGFGLGLWIVRQVVEAMGGRITVRSKAGAGSVFSVELPRVPRVEEPAPLHH